MTNAYHRSLKSRVCKALRLLTSIRSACDERTDSGSVFHYSIRSALQTVCVQGVRWIISMPENDTAWPLPARTTYHLFVHFRSPRSGARRRDCSRYVGQRAVFITARVHSWVVPSSGARQPHKAPEKRSVTEEIDRSHLKHARGCSRAPCLSQHRASSTGKHSRTSPSFGAITLSRRFKSECN